MSRVVLCCNAEKTGSEGAAGGRSKQRSPPMSTLTYDIAATAQAATPTAPPARKRKGPPEAGHAGARPPWPAPAARTGRGRAEDQRAERGFAAVRSLRAGAWFSHQNVSECLGFGRTHLGKVLLLIFRALCGQVRHYAAVAIVLCSIAAADGTSNRYYGCNAEVGWVRTTTSAI